MSKNYYNKQPPLDLTDSDADKSDDEAIGFLLDRAKRGENLDKQRAPSICKVSRILRDLSVRSFIPQLVSIGPIHREDRKLREFEWQKERYLNDLLNRCDSTPKKTLEACLQKIKKKIPQIRESYAGMKKNYSDVDLALMMVMDGCFILEFCFKHEEENRYLPNKMQNLRIALDLMLLENQIPYVVLQDLFDCLAPYIFKWKGPVTLSQVLDTYLAPYINLFRSQLREEIPTTYVDSDSTDHVLGYLHRRYQLVVAKSSNNPKHAEASKPVDEEQAAKSSKPIHTETLMLEDEERIENTAFHSIAELNRSGMKFKPHQEDNWSMAFKFQSPHFPCVPWFGSKATLLMPTLVIDEFTELILRNFIAYEQSFPQVSYYFTSYVLAMDMLIDTQEDIAKLVESEVLVNDLGTNQEAADLINKICRNISITDFYYAKEFKQMDKYYNCFWATFNARMRRIYDSAAMTRLMFYLTVIQTYYTITAA